MSTLSVKVISDVTALSYVDASLAAANSFANSIGTSLSSAYSTANASFNTANAAFASANNVAPQVTPSYNTANSAYNTANAAFNAANNVNLGPVFTVANAGFNVANAAFAKANTGLSNGNMFIAGNVSPSSSNTYDLGSSTARWRNIYTGDLHLSNEFGNWTIVEGEDELFLYNNLKDKVYKFNLTEVDPSTAPPKKGV